MFSSRDLTLLSMNYMHAYRKHGLRRAQEGANAAATFVKFFVEQQPQVVGPNHAVVFHELVMWTQQWQGLVEGNDGMTVSRDACVAIAAKLPCAAMSLAHQLIEEIYDCEHSDTQQHRPSLAQAALEDALDDLQRSVPSPQGGGQLSREQKSATCASNNTLIDLCGQLKYLQQEVQPTATESA
jgi:hypothetical protein